jgi:adenylate cyclase class 2
MLEIEMKFPVADFHGIEESLSHWHAGPPERRQDADRYFNAPDRDFGKTDEALRLRSIGTKNFITYKGPKTDTQTKTRFELELPLPDGPDMVEQFGQLLHRLGYHFVAQVEKGRTIYHVHRDGFHLEICLDEVKGLGQFVEVEIVAPEEQLDQARTVLMSVAGEMNLTHSERRSYLQMLLEKAQCT